MEMRRLVLTAALMIGLGAAASGQEAGSGWERMAIPDGSIWPDTLWPQVPGESAPLLAATSDGRLFALTRDGVYRARNAGTGLRPPRPGRSPRPSAGVALHIPGLPGILPASPGRMPVRLRVLADGRAVSGADRPSGMP